jgi:hypothetical protein
MFVLGPASERFVVDSVVRRDELLPVCPQKGDEVDTSDHPVMLPAPVVSDKRDLLRVRLVECCVVEDQTPEFLLTMCSASSHSAPVSWGVLRRSLVNGS